MHSAQRTLVKSPPELWAEISDPDALARHLGGFGEIRISRVEPEATVAWEGDRVRGTVSLEPSGWGTKVTLTAEAPEPVRDVVPEVLPDPVPEAVIADPEPEPELAPRVADEPATRAGFLARLFRRRRPVPVPAPAVVAPEPEPEPEPDPEPVAVEPEAVAVQPVPEPEPSLDSDETLAALEAVLDDLGAAHHRPFSRG
jgi:hypothetical protein